MSTFTINDENHVAMFRSSEEATQVDHQASSVFDSQVAFAKVSARDRAYRIAK